MAILCGGWIRILGGFNTTFEVTVLVVPRQNGTQYFSPASEGKKKKKEEKSQERDLQERCYRYRFKWAASLVTFEV